MICRPHLSPDPTKQPQSETTAFLYVGVILPVFMLLQLSEHPPSLPMRYIIVSLSLQYYFVVFVGFFRVKAPTYSSEPKGKHSDYCMKCSRTDCCPNVWICLVLSICFECMNFKKCNMYFYYELLKYCGFMSS